MDFMFNFIEISKKDNKYEDKKTNELRTIRCYEKEKKKCFLQVYYPYLLNMVSFVENYVVFERVEGEIFDNCNIEENQNMIFAQILIGFEILNHCSFDVEKCKIYLIEKNHVKIGVIFFLFSINFLAFDECTILSSSNSNIYKRLNKLLLNLKIENENVKSKLEKKV
jgi:hypothetical protein